MFRRGGCNLFGLRSVRGPITFVSLSYSYIHCSDDEHSARSSSIIIKRRAQALIMFVGHAIIPTSSADISKGDNATTELVSLLVDLATIEGDSNISDILSVTQQTTSKVMNAIGAAEFLNGALVMLQSDETRVGLYFLYETLSHIVSRSRLVLLKSSQRGYPELQMQSVANNRRQSYRSSTLFETSFLASQPVR